MIVAIGWGIAAVIALVVLGAIGFELKWKSARLRTDISDMRGALADLETIQRQLSDAAVRLNHPDPTN